MNRMRKMFFASTLLFNSILCNCNVKGMNISDLPVVEIKRKHDVEALAPIVPIDPIKIKYIKLSESNKSKMSYQDLEKDLGWTLLKRDFFRIGENCKYKYCFNPKNSYLDNSYAAFCIDCLSEVNFDKLVVSNNQLPNSVDYKNLKLEEKLGFKIFYLMLANICIDWLIHNNEINEIYDKERNNDDFDIRALINSAKKLENLNSSYVSNYIKESLINGRKAKLYDRDPDPNSKLSHYQSSGILFDDNIFLSSDLGNIDDIVFSHFSCDYDGQKRTVTFRFFRQTKENTQPMMIVIREAYPGIIPVGVQNYEIFFYDEEGYEIMISGNDSLEQINKTKSTMNLLFM